MTFLIDHPISKNSKIFVVFLDKLFSHARLVYLTIYETLSGLCMYTRILRLSTARICIHIYCYNIQLLYMIHQYIIIASPRASADFLSRYYYNINVLYRLLITRVFYLPKIG